MKSIIVTTIHPPSNALKVFSKLGGWNFISAGDLKTPSGWQLPNIEYLSPQNQSNLFPKFSKLLFWNRYARKNIGYLYAIKTGSKLIAEIDDDIAPYNTYPPSVSSDKTVPVLSGEKFVNIYNFFGSQESWPRGYPISRIMKKQKINKFVTTAIKQRVKKVYSPVQNSLLDQNGDFDAIYRLVSDKNIKYKQKGEFALDKGVYCPFHSGNTFWHPQAFVLLYLPAFVNPHVEDIWRGYIAQRLIWEINGHLTFIYPTVYTNQRNKHNYLKDFEFEIPMFLQTEKLISVLDSLSLSHNLGRSLIKIYTALIKEGIMKKEELPAVSEWVKQLEKLL